MASPSGRGFTALVGGAVLAFGLLLGAEASAQTTVSGNLAAGDPTWNRSSCAGGAGFYYDLYPIAHGGGPLTVRMNGATSGSGTLGDPYLYLYNAPFDPALPCANRVTQDDDGGGGLNSLITGNYPAGNYVILASSFNLGETGTYQVIYSAVAPVPVAPAAAVPTLGEWGLVGLALALAGVAGGALRRRRMG